MTFTSKLYLMATNPQHPSFDEMYYNSDQPNYYHKDNTVYKRQGIWARDFINWLEQMGITVGDDRSVYIPVIKVENGVVTTWETHQANMGNKFLQLDESTRTLRYPNLYFVQIGMHPYPRQARFHNDWSIEQAQKESHRIIYPHYDPKQHFLLPKDIGF